MAEAFTKYRADDGSEFATMAQAVEHDALCREVDGLCAMLHPTPQGCDFSNGDGYVRQSRAAALGFQRGLVAIARRYFNRDDIYDRHFEHAARAQVPVGHTFVGRLINEGCPAVVWRAWSRLMCMGEDFREWGQPYFASHPHEAKQIDRTPRTVTEREASP